MATVLLLRHGRTAANTGGVLAGWTPGVHLDDVGRGQAKLLGERLADLQLVAIVTSPLERCQETVEPVLAGRDGVPLHLDERLGEARYGDWTGAELKKLTKDPLWRVVQGHPSAAVFPGDEGESMAGMQARAVAAVRDWNARLGADATYLVCSHGDVIKAVLADALGMHFDQFQRIQVDPCSLSVVRYSTLRPFVERINDSGGSIAGLKPVPRRRRTRKASASDAEVGGGAGPPSG